MNYKLTHSNSQEGYGYTCIRLNYEGLNEFSKIYYHVEYYYCPIEDRPARITITSSIVNPTDHNRVNVPLENMPYSFIKEIVATIDKQLEDLYNV